MKKKLTINIPDNKNNEIIKEFDLSNNYLNDINNRNNYISYLQNSGKSISPKKEEDNIWNMNKYDNKSNNIINKKIILKRKKD